MLIKSIFLIILTVPLSGPSAQRADDGNNFAMMSMLLIFAVILYLFRPSSLRRSTNDLEKTSQEPPNNGQVIQITVCDVFSFSPGTIFLFHLTGSRWCSTKCKLMLNFNLFRKKMSTAVWKESNKHRRIEQKQKKNISKNSTYTKFKWTQVATTNNGGTNIRNAYMITEYLKYSGHSRCEWLPAQRS